MDIVIVIIILAIISPSLGMGALSLFILFGIMMLVLKPFLDY